MDEPAKPFEHLKWANGRTPDLATYMYAGDNVRAVFRVAKTMEQFALNFAPDVTVPEPQRRREKVKNALKKALEKYN